MVCSYFIRFVKPIKELIVVLFDFLLTFYARVNTVIIIISIYFILDIL